MADPDAAYVEEMTRRIFPQASNNRFALNEYVKQLIRVVNSMTMSEFALLRSILRPAGDMENSKDMALVTRLEALCKRLYDEGRYVDANIVHLAFEAVARHEAVQTQTPA